MLKLDDLKAWLHKKTLTKTDKLLIVLGSFDAPRKVSDIKARAREADLTQASRWNIGAFLSASGGRAINLPEGWELAAAGREYLAHLGVFKKLPRIEKVAVDFRTETQKITNPQTRAFIDEAISCFEYDLFRSAIVMSWMSALDVLHGAVIKGYLKVFNAEAARRDPKWKPARTTDDLGRMKEYDFISCIYQISMIGKNVRDELHLCLKRRNGCGHPNSLKLGANTVASHLEFLILNVFRKF